MSLRLVSLTSCVVLSLACFASGCSKDESPPTADPSAADPAPVDPAPADPAPADPDDPAPTAPTAGEPDTPADPDQPRLSPQEIARFAVVVAEIECTAAKFDDPADHQKAVEATLTRAGLTRESYDAQVMAYLNDPTFEATRERTLEMCKATAADRGGDDPASADPEVGLREKIRTLAVASECMRKAGATSEEMMPAMLALYAAHGVELEEFSREMARLSATPGFAQEVAAAAAECPEAPVVAEVDGEPVDGEPVDGEPVDGEPVDGDGEGDGVEPPPEAPKPTIAGTYRGSLPGGGRITVTLRENGTLRSGSATINKRSYTLTGRVAPNRSLAFAATSGRDWVRFSGKLVPSRGTMTGKFQGVVGSKKAAGGFTAKR